MMTFLQQYPVEKRKKIALWCAIGVGVLLLGVLVIVYTSPWVPSRAGLSTLIAGGYTTFIESAQSYFMKK